MPEKELARLKDRVCAANLSLVRHGLVKLTWGNVSGLTSDGRFVVIKPIGVSYDNLLPKDMVVLSLEDGKTIDGQFRPNSDAPTHLALYRAWAGLGVNGIVHTHSPAATAFAQLCRELPCSGTTHADHFYGSVPLARHLSPTEVAQDYEANTGAVILERFRDLDPLAVPAVLVSGHAPFTWGHSPEEAVSNSVALEEIAGMAQRMAALGGDQPILPQYIQDKHYHRKHGSAAAATQK